MKSTSIFNLLMISRQCAALVVIVIVCPSIWFCPVSMFMFDFFFSIECDDACALHERNRLVIFTYFFFFFSMIFLFKNSQFLFSTFFLILPLNIWVMRDIWLILCFLVIDSATFVVYIILSDVLLKLLILRMLIGPLIKQSAFHHFLWLRQS